MFGTDLYYNGEALGYRVVVVGEEPLRYEFNIRMLIEGPDGGFWFGADSGCSCPSPFEGFDSIGDFTRVFSPADVEREVGDDRALGENANWSEFMAGARQAMTGSRI